MVYPADELENLIANRPSIGTCIIETLVERLSKTTEELKAVTKELVGKQICTVDYSNISTWLWMCGRPEGLLMGSHFNQLSPPPEVVIQPYLTTLVLLYCNYQLSL